MSIRAAVAAGSGSSRPTISTPPWPWPPRAPPPAGRPSRCGRSRPTPGRKPARGERSQWDRDLIAEGQSLVAACIRRDRPGSYQVKAAINAVHSDAPTAAEVEGSAAALAAVDALDLGGYHLFHATRADLLRRLGHHRVAAEAYDAAIALVANAAERRFLEQRRRSFARRLKT